MEALNAARMMEGLREHSAGLAGSATTRDPFTRVPTCPEWTLQDLVGHVGGAHRWAAHLIRTGGVQDGGNDAVTALPLTAPDDPELWAGWLLDGAEQLIGALEANPDGTVEHPFLGTWPAVRWLRRMTHETAVHHADAALTAGTPFAPAPDLAADAITEALELLTRTSAAKYKPELAELRGRGETLCLRPAEPSVAGWLIIRASDGPAFERVAAHRHDVAAHRHDEAHVTVTGPVRDLLLVLARRLAPDDGADVKVTGDRSLLDHWLARTAV